MNGSTVSCPLYLVSVITLALAGCGSPSGPAPLPAPLNADNLNLVFVVSEDLAHNAPGDFNTNTANLNNQGLQRSLQMGAFLKQQVLGGSNVTGIYSLEPMTHLQTANNYPDMVALETVQQLFACAERMFRALAIGNVAEVSNPAVVLAIGAQHGRRIAVKDGPVFKQKFVSRLFVAVSVKIHNPLEKCLLVRDLRA